MAKDTAAIIVAGGQGIRFGGKVRKQYLLLAGRPILWWSLQAFEKSPSIGEIVLVVPAEDTDSVQRRTRDWKFSKLLSIVAGGMTRADSVRNGLQIVPSHFGWVAIHDAVRPLVTVETIEKTVREARRSRAAIAASRSRDTVKLSDAEDHIISTPVRERVWLAQTPQVFDRSLLLTAHAKGTGIPVTDDAQLVERLGVKVKLIESPVENFKVTLPIDLLQARNIMAKRS